MHKHTLQYVYLELRVRLAEAWWHVVLSFNAFETELKPKTIDAIVASARPTKVHLGLPKFKIESKSIFLEQQLKALGIQKAFMPTLADFSRISKDKDEPFFIGAVIHKAFFAVDERGTEAAAATAVAIPSGSAPDLNKIQFNINRPFFFAIRDQPTGSLLFIGRVMNPIS